jgi:stress response protein YsnF
MAWSLVLPGQHQQRTGIPSRVTASPITIPVGNSNHRPTGQPGGAQFGGDRVTVAYDKATIKDAPNVDGERHLDPDEERQLYRHYGLDYGSDTAGRRTGRDELRNDIGTAAGTGRVGTDRTEGYDTSGPTTDTAMTRSEEHLRAGTETQDVGRARLRKHAVTEHEQVTVPVSHEEVRIEREPITDANRSEADDGPAISDEEHEVTCAPSGRW